MKIQCLVCDKKNSVQPQRRGNTIIEVILWCFYLVPGLIYTLWRNGGNEYTCPICKSKSVKILELEEVPRKEDVQKKSESNEMSNFEKEILSRTNPNLSPKEKKKILKADMKATGGITILFFILGAITPFFFILATLSFLALLYSLFEFYKISKQSEEKSLEKKKTSRATKWIVGSVLGIPVFFVLLGAMMEFWEQSNAFELKIGNGAYQIISANQIETKKTSFDLNLETKGVTSLLVDNKPLQASNAVSYPITLSDDKTLRIEAKNKKSETKTILLKVDFLTEAEITEREKKAEEQARIKKEKAESDKKALAEKELADTKSELLTTIQTYNEGLAPYEDWKLVEIIKKGRSSEDSEIQNLARQLQTLAENFQAKEFPQKRAAYAKELRNKLWEDDYEIKISGTAKDVLTIIHWSFAANKPKQEFQTLFRDKFYDLRFSKVRYMWYDGSEYSQYTLESLLDRKIKGLD